MAPTTRFLAATALLSLALVSYGSSAAAADSWSVARGTAEASGTTRPVEMGGLHGPGLAVEGELRTTGPGCSTLWIQWAEDLTVGPPFTMGTRCGTGSIPVRFVRPAGLGQTWVKLCNDTNPEAPHANCSEPRYVR
ncbi:hypothetical protein [Streptomyces sp. NPDC087212]|uniref:hypothetical protein n=1 Tax=Streptomyces sp. NPDC087212 TaxID=3365766 RepID=UPI0037F99239